MEYNNFTTFSVNVEDSIAWVTFDFPPVNVQGLRMLADLNKLAQKLEANPRTSVATFEYGNGRTGGGDRYTTLVQ